MAFAQQGIESGPIASKARAGRDLIARHGETVFNAVGRLQGEHVHTPLTRAGFRQAEAIGAALLAELGPCPALTLWSSPSGRALQTLAIVAEMLTLDREAVHIDPRLVELGTGSWGGRTYASIEAERGAIVDRETRLLHEAPDGERYTGIAARVGGWARDTGDDAGDRLVIMHGISSRVLRGVLTGVAIDSRWNAPIAPGLPQGSIVAIEGGRERVVHRGGGGGAA